MKDKDYNLVRHFKILMASLFPRKYSIVKTKRMNELIALEKQVIANEIHRIALKSCEQISDDSTTVKENA